MAALRASSGRRLSATRGELRGQLVILAVVLWAVALVNTATPTRQLRSGQIKGTDFVQFYTLGRLAAEGHADQFDDYGAIRRTQLAAVPESENVVFPPVYGPQVPIALSPLGHLTYESALLTWVTLSVVVYFFFVWLLARAAPRLRMHVGLTCLGAAAFPPFWQLVQHGQLTMVAVTALVGAWWALRSGREVAFGACLGLLAYKPPLVAPVLILLLFIRAWRPLAAASVVGLAQVLVAAWWIGLAGVWRYVDLLLGLPGMASALRSNPAQTHGWRGFLELLLGESVPVTVLSAVLILATLVLAAAIWRRVSDPSLRMAVLSVTVALAAPYLFVYDLAILAPAWIWLVDWFLRQPVPASVGRALYLGYLSPLFAPAMPYIRFQISVPVMAFLLVSVWRWTRAHEEVGS